MKSQKRRVQKLESVTMNEREDVPNNLTGIYALEDDSETDTSKALDALYNPNRGTRNPNDAI
ncbi:hypothetical protein [Halalkalibaculum sp. DA384]|uniref:hypothetical protein n=1 Tax=Halalkalibaculum sp. DA384 TaxID=3373606 RepID=UPI0037545807